MYTQITNRHGGMGVLYSTICGYLQVYRHQDVLERWEWLCAGLMYMLCAIEFPREAHILQEKHWRPAIAID